MLKIYYYHNLMKIIFFFASIYLAYKCLKALNLIKQIVFEHKRNSPTSTQSGAKNQTPDTKEAVYKAEYRILGEKD